jgi:hypothetical protein
MHVVSASADESKIKPFLTHGSTWSSLEVGAEEKEKMFLCCFNGTCQLYSISLEHGFRRDMKSARQRSSQRRRKHLSRHQTPKRGPRSTNWAVVSAAQPKERGSDGLSSRLVTWSGDSLAQRGKKEGPDISPLLATTKVSFLGTMHLSERNHII